MQHILKALLDHVIGEYDKSPKPKDAEMSKEEKTKAQGFIDNMSGDSPQIKDAHLSEATEKYKTELARPKTWLKCMGIFPKRCSLFSGMLSKVLI